MWESSATHMSQLPLFPTVLPSTTLPPPSAPPPAPLPLHQHPNFAAHPAFKSPVPLQFLCGTWKGEGTGMYPTFKDFPYIEEVSDFYFALGECVSGRISRRWFKPFIRSRFSLARPPSHSFFI